MLQQIFLTIFDMSIAAGYCVLFVIIIRFFLRKLPKSYSYALWAIVLLRLLLPVMPESDWSLLPAVGLPFVEKDMSNFNDNSVNIQDMPDLPFTNGSEILSTTASSEYIAGSEVLEETDKSKMQSLALMKMLPGKWFLVALILMVRVLASNIFLKKRLKGAEKIGRDIFRKEGLPTAFVTGFIRPRIYLPDNIQKEHYRYVLVHERVHIRRGDVLVKHITYFLTCIHWFNPLIWLAFYLMCRDMEMSCDEQVLRTLGLEEKKAYSMAILSIASGRSLQLGMPIAFSESGARSRIKNVLNYRMPTMWIAGATGLMILVVAAGLLCNPSEDIITITTEQEKNVPVETSISTEFDENWHTLLKEEIYAEDIASWINDVLLEHRHIGWFKEYNGEKLQRISDIIFYKADNGEELQNTVQTMITHLTQSSYVGNVFEQKILPVSAERVWLVKYIGNRESNVYILLKEEGVYRLQKVVDMLNYKTQELSLENVPIYESDLKDLNVLSNKLTEAMNLCFLFKEFEHVDDIDVEWFTSMMFEFVDKDYTNAITSYFDENALYESMAKKVGQTPSVFIDMHQVKRTGYGKIYNRPDGEAVLAKISVLHVERTDGVGVEILYSCYWEDERSYFHYGDGKVTMREKDGEMIFVSNERVDLKEKPYPTDYDNEETKDKNVQILKEVNGEVVGVIITDGSNGNQISITGVENICELDEKVNEIEILEKEDISNVNSKVGYQYSLKYLNASKNVIKSITLQGSNIIIDKVTYKVESTENLVSYILKLYS